MPTETDVARAIAFFERSFDVVLLRRLLVEAAPRARRQMLRLVRQGGEDAIPAPARVTAAAQAAGEAEAMKTLTDTSDFALLQAMTRAIGRRVEVLGQPPSNN